MERLLKMSDESREKEKNREIGKRKKVKIWKNGSKNLQPPLSSHQKICGVNPYKKRKNRFEVAHIEVNAKTQHCISIEIQMHFGDSSVALACFSQRIPLHRQFNCIYIECNV